MAGFLAATGAMTMANTPARAEIFYIFVTDPPGKVDAVQGSAGSVGPVTNYGTSPTSPIDDIALRITNDPATTLIWGITHRQGGGNPATLSTYVGGFGTATTTVVAPTLTGPASTAAVNALAWNPTGTMMWTAASNLGSVMTITDTGVSTAIGSYTAAGNNINAAFQAIHPQPDGYNYTVTSAGDLIFQYNPATQVYDLFATLFIEADPIQNGQQNINETWLATINQTTGAATLIGPTTVTSAAGEPTLLGDNIRIEGLALDSQSPTTLWGTDAHHLFTINTLTGALTWRFTDNSLNSIGATGVLPEPATLALFGTGLAGLWAIRRRKRRVA